MDTPINAQVSFEEWALDVTLAKHTGAIAFVPICGDEVVWGLTYCQDRCPGTLTGVVSQDGIEDAQRWAAENSTWQIDYAKATDLSEATCALAP